MNRSTKRLVDHMRDRGWTADEELLEHYADEAVLCMVPEEVIIEELEAENERLRAGMAGDYDLDAWLDWCTEKTALLSKLDEALSGYAEAVDDIEFWAAYAGDYFQTKHDLAGDLEKHRARVRGLKEYQS